jgi:anti-sigma-K factor RskA
MSTATEKVRQGERITRDDIEAKLRELRGEVDEVGNATKSYAIAAGAAVAVAVIALAYMFGKRKAKRKTTIVEVRRV